MQTHTCTVFQASCPLAQPFSAPTLSAMARVEDYDPSSTREGYLPPWELAKAFAFYKVIQHMSEQQGVPACEVTGKRVDELIAEQVALKGGGNPTARAVRKALVKCEDAEWYPGKQVQTNAGRKRLYSEHVLNEAARVAMDLKAKKQKVCPRNVRARLSRLAVNPETGQPISDFTLRTKVFTVRCYGKTEEDPWVYRRCLSKTYLPESMWPKRVETAEHVLAQPAGAWFNHVAVDPCASLLARTEARSEEQQVAALGDARWMSNNAALEPENLKADAYAKTQAGSNVLKVHWTPVLCRGKVEVYVCDTEAAVKNPALPWKLNDSANLAKFVQNVLPGILQAMKDEHGWTSLPRTVVHDKASYMVTSLHNQLNGLFASALHQAGLKSWVGEANASAAWLAPRLGDVYPHETAIGHIRNLLDGKFQCTRVGETEAQFRARMAKVVQYMNGPELAAKDGRGLLGICKALRPRCEELKRSGGRRLRT